MSSNKPHERIDPWLQVLWDKRGSDLLLVSGSPPRVRVDGGLRPLNDVPALSGSDIEEIVASMLTPDQRAILEEHQDVDFSFSWLDRARMRGSAFHQRGELALALRMIPSDIPDFEELGLPPVAEWMARLPGFLPAPTIKRIRWYWVSKVIGNGPIWPATTRHLRRSALSAFFQAGRSRFRRR